MLKASTVEVHEKAPPINERGSLDRLYELKYAEADRQIQATTKPGIIPGIALFVVSDLH